MKVIFTVLFSLLMLPAFSESWPTKFEVAKAKGEFLKVQPGFNEFNSGAFGQVFGPCGANAFRYCFANVENPSSEPFEFVLGVSNKGVLERIYLSKHTNIAVCFAEHLCNQDFPLFKGKSYFYHEKIVFKP